MPRVTQLSKPHLELKGKVRCNQRSATESYVNSAS
jgi:hypothetical protein